MYVYIRTESTPANVTPLSMNGATVVLRDIPPASPHAATVPPYRTILSALPRTTPPT